MSNPMIAQEIMKLIEENERLVVRCQEADRKIKDLDQALTRAKQELDTYHKASGQGVEVGL